MTAKPTSVVRSISDNRWFLAIVVALAVFPFVAPPFIGSFYTVLMIEAMIFAIFALAYDILMGHTGMISLGHAAYFGLGIYGGALTLLHLSEALLPLLIVSVVLSGLFAAIVGYFSIRSTGVYFALITFAFAQILYEVVIRSSDFLGGNNGLAAPAPKLFTSIALGEMSIYYLVFLSMILLYLGVRRLMNSPLGLIFQSIEENDQRVEFIGYDVRWYKHISFIISGMLSGFAGGLFVAHEGFASPNMLFWMLSGEIIIMVIFGGVGSLYGPMIGAGLFIYLETYLNSTIDAWQIVLGLIFITVVLLFPKGLAGSLEESDWDGLQTINKLRDRLSVRE